MNEHKNLLIVLGEWWEQRRANSCAVVVSNPPGRLRRLLRWLMPNGGTLILIALLIVTQSVWARPLQSAANAPGPSATTVNYQGRLADQGGNPITQNSVTLRFALYDAATGGNLVWPTTGPETHVVNVSNGLFSVGLGSQTSGGIPTNVWNGDRYLEITVGSETLSPRELIRSVPIAGMALTVPDGAIGTAQIADGAVTPHKIDLDHGVVCLSGHAQVSLPGSNQQVDVPGLSLSFSLPKSSQVLVWIDGLAKFPQSSAGEADIILSVDNVDRTASFGYETGDYHWFNVKGQRLLNLDSGTHSITVKASSDYQGTMLVHGVGAYRTCINYLVLGEQ